jgi:hypothetical protein
VIKKSIAISLVAIVILGYIIYDARKNGKSGGKLERVQGGDLPDNLRDVFNTLQKLKYEVTTNKTGDNPTISFKTIANGTNYSIVIKTQGEVLIYDNISGTPYRLLIKDNVIKNSNGQVVSTGNDIANGILQIINNKDYL